MFKYTDVNMEQQRVVMEKSLRKGKGSSALPSQILMIYGRTKHSNIFEISDQLVSQFLFTLQFNNKHIGLYFQSPMKLVEINHMVVK